MTTKYISQLTNTKPAGANLHDVKQALDRYTEICEFNYQTTDVLSQIILRGNDSKGIRLTYKITDSDGLYNSVRYHEISQPWLIDLATVGINEITHVGGMVDGSAAVPSADCLVWAFFDDSGTKFRGFGATRRPFVIYTSISPILGVAGDKGSTTRFNMSGIGNSNGLYYAIGSEVLAVNGITQSAQYNHGVVVATGLTFVDVLIDNSARYGSLNISNTPGGLFQTTKFAPLDSLGNRFGGFYSKYICNLQSGVAPATIINIRRRGDVYYFIERFFPKTTTLGGGLSELIPAIQFIPKHALAGIMEIVIVNKTNPGGFSLAPEGGEPLFLSTYADAQSQMRNFGTVPYNKFTKNWLASVSPPTSNVLTANTFLLGYTGETEF